MGQKGREAKGGSVDGMNEGAKHFVVYLDEVVMGFWLSEERAAGACELFGEGSRYECLAGAMPTNVELAVASLATVVRLPLPSRGQESGLYAAV